MSQFYYENGLDEGQYRKKRWVCPANTVCGGYTVITLSVRRDTFGYVFVILILMWLFSHSK